MKEHGQVDKVRDWKWLPDQMPGVAALIAERRKTLGRAHVNKCWKKGVEDGLPGWFFAREGALWVGTPFEDQEMLDLAQRQDTATQVFLAIREVDDGSH